MQKFFLSLFPFLSPSPQGSLPDDKEKLQISRPPAQKQVVRKLPRVLEARPPEGAQETAHSTGTAQGMGSEGIATIVLCLDLVDFVNLSYPELRNEGGGFRE